MYVSVLIYWYMIEIRKPKQFVGSMFLILASLTIESRCLKYVLQRIFS